MKNFFKLIIFILLSFIVANAKDSSTNTSILDDVADNTNIKDSGTDGSILDKVKFNVDDNETVAKQFNLKGHTFTIDNGHYRFSGQEYLISISGGTNFANDSSFTKSTSLLLDDTRVHLVSSQSYYTNSVDSTSNYDAGYYLSIKLYVPIWSLPNLRIDHSQLSINTSSSCDESNIGSCYDNDTSRSSLDYKYTDILFYYGLGNDRTIRFDVGLGARVFSIKDTQEMTRGTTVTNNSIDNTGAAFLLMLGLRVEPWIVGLELNAKFAWNGNVRDFDTNSLNIARANIFATLEAKGDIRILDFKKYGAASIEVGARYEFVGASDSGTYDHPYTITEQSLVYFAGLKYQF